MSDAPKDTPKVKSEPEPEPKPTKEGLACRYNFKCKKKPVLCKRCDKVTTCEDHRGKCIHCKKDACVRCAFECDNEQDVYFCRKCARKKGIRPTECCESMFCVRCRPPSTPEDECICEGVEELNSDESMSEEDEEEDEDDRNFIDDSKLESDSDDEESAAYHAKLEQESAKRMRKQIDTNREKRRKIKT